MCGLAGIIGANNSDPKLVEKMVETIMYRGPDEWGVKQHGPAVLGHARLAVVDPENGHQPMFNTDGTVGVVFNGEIYNHVALREELKKKGYVFKSRCDTEVLVHLWREEGEAMLKRLIGMFAFFLWDEKEKRGVLVRDHTGIKPCYVMEHDGGWAFCSEIKGLLALPGVKREINYNGLARMFALNYCPPPDTCFKNIHHLEPGTYWHFDSELKITKHRYWEWPFFAERHTPDFDEFATLLRDAVRMQKDFDVKGGLYLSGGIDSSVVAKYLVEQWPGKLEAIGLDFPVDGFSEYAYSRLVADQLGLALKPAMIDHTLIPELAEKVIYHTDQPHGDFSFFLFYLLASKAHGEGKIVMFTGDGPDETLFGFNHNVEFFQDTTRTNFPLRAYYNVICYMDDGLRKRLLRDTIHKHTQDPFDYFEKTLEPWRDLQPIEQIIAYECTQLMPGNNLVKGDRMGACWSTEGRSPFMDHRVIELFTRLPLTEKIDRGIGKSYLKKHAAEVFSREFVYGKKRMPTTPIGNWLQDPLYHWARDLLAGTNDDIINTQEAVKLLDEHKEGKANHTRPLRTLIMTALWLKTFFNS